MKYRITFEDSKGTRFSYLDGDNEMLLEEGEWQAPFPNEDRNSTAFGLVEAIMQSDRCPIDFLDNGVVCVKVRKVN